MINIRSYGADPNLDDNSSHFNSAFKDSSYSTLYIPAGVYKIAAPLTAIDRPLKVLGDGKNSTVLLKEYSSSDSLISSVRGDLILKDLALIAGKKSSQGAAVELSTLVLDGVQGGVQAFAADGSYLDNVYISSWGGSWDYGLVIDGSDRNPMGIRTIFANNIDIFDCGVILDNVKGLNLNVNIYDTTQSDPFLHIRDCDNILISSYHLGKVAMHDSRNVKFHTAFPIDKYPKEKLTLWKRIKNLLNI